MENIRSLQMFDYDRMEFALLGYFRAHEYWAGIDALSFAKKMHGETKRKSSELKYICHPMLVAYLASLLGLDPEIVAIALLHDVTEDAHADFTALPGGARVQNGVKAVTIMKIKPDESKSDTKVRYYGRMDENIDALIVKLLDRFTNLSSMVGALSQESIEKNILETDQKLLPAVKRARKTKLLEFRQQRDTLFVLQQVVRSLNEPLAMLFKIGDVQRKKHDLARTHARLEGRLEARNSKDDFVFEQSDMALMSAFECQAKYQNGDSRALRAMLLAAFAVAFGVHEDTAIATILLGDLPNVDVFIYNADVQHALRRLSMMPMEKETPEKTTERFYAELSQCKEALLAKTLYRWYEICYGQVNDGGSISDDEMTRLVQETDKYLIPALEESRTIFGEFSSILEFMIFVLRMTYETVAAYKHIELPSIQGFYERKLV